MRQALLSCIIFLYALQSFAGNAFYAHLAVNPTMIGNKPSLLAGGSIVYNFGNNYNLSIGSYNMISRNIRANFLDTSINARPIFEYNYFSSAFEYIFNPEENFSYGIQTKFSLGHIRYNLISTEKNLLPGYNPDYGEDWFLAFEPNLSVYYNLRPWLKFLARTGWRFPFDASYSYAGNSFNNSKLRKPFCEIAVELGNF
ncbi:MAG TPA: hypothetical protein PL149_07960 [Candidatus Kapabacteria bacterium]|nr:hypothetical protein [Candidatus Kapabacteria bacterium]